MGNAADESGIDTAVESPLTDHRIGDHAETQQDNLIADKRNRDLERVEELDEVLAEEKHNRDFVPNSITPVQDSLLFQQLPQFFPSPMVQVHCKTIDNANPETDLYVSMQVFNKVEYGLENVKNLLGTLLAAGVIVSAATKFLSSDDEIDGDNADLTKTSTQVYKGGKTVATLAAIGFAACHVVNAVYGNCTNKDNNIKYVPRDIPNVCRAEN